AVAALKSVEKKDSLLSLVDTMRKRLFGDGTAPNKTPLDVGKPIFTEFIQALDAPNATSLNFYGLAYDGHYLLLSVGTPGREGAKWSLVQLDPIKRTVRKIPSPPVQVTDLTISDGKLLAHAPDALWLRDRDGNWREVFHGQSES